MFGYITPKKSELKVKDFELYNTIYCSLCRTLQKEYGVVSKALLNYDFVLLALIGLSLKDKEQDFLNRRCTTNPLKKQTFIEDDVLSYSASCLIITAYYSLCDNILDERFFKKTFSFLARLVIYPSYMKACNRFNDVALAVKKSFSSQLKLEKESTSNLDEAADPSAIALSYMFEQLGSSDEEKRILLRLGYFLGRFVYLADSCDDLVSDINSGKFNPLANKYGIISVTDERIEEILEEMKHELFLTRSELASTYVLLKVKRYMEILDNIIYLGMTDTISSSGDKKAKGNLTYSSRERSKK